MQLREQRNTATPDATASSLDHTAHHTHTTLMTLPTNANNAHKNYVPHAYQTLQTDSDVGKASEIPSRTSEATVRQDLANPRTHTR